MTETQNGPESTPETRTKRNDPIGIIFAVAWASMIGFFGDILPLGRFPVYVVAAAAAAAGFVDSAGNEVPLRLALRERLKIIHAHPAATRGGRFEVSDRHSSYLINPLRYTPSKNSIDWPGARRTIAFFHWGR